MLLVVLEFKYFRPYKVLLRMRPNLYPLPIKTLLNKIPAMYFLFTMLRQISHCFIKHYRAPAAIVFLFFCHAVAAQELNYVFKAGESGYSCFRIPAIVTTNGGTLLAFAEARRNNCGDAGDIDLVLKRSTDMGRSWSAIEIIWDDDANTCGNPAPVVDRTTGRIVLLSTWNLGEDHEWQIIDGISKNTRRIFMFSSTDDGRTWSTAKEITKSVKQDNWTWYATGPVNGIQIRKGKYRGRLVVPCDHIEAGSKKYFSHTIYSDDGGATWALGGTTPQDQVNECTVAELSRGRLLLNMRNYGSSRVRKTAISKDGGESWSDLREDASLIEPVCQASLIAYDVPGKKKFLVFSNPADTKSRVRMTARISYDEGKTWPMEKLLHAGPSAYSNMVVLPNSHLACYFEGGAKSPYEGIAFQEIRLAGFIPADKQ